MEINDHVFIVTGASSGIGLVDVQRLRPLSARQRHI